jgi:MFS family permease
VRVGAALIALRFFGGVDPSTAFVLALLAFASGFVVRPIGALVFGRLGDLIGRKYTFLVSIVVMGAIDPSPVGPAAPPMDAIGVGSAGVPGRAAAVAGGWHWGGEYGGGGRVRG